MIIPLIIKPAKVVFQTHNIQMQRGIENYISGAEKFKSTAFIFKKWIKLLITQYPYAFSLSSWETIEFC